MLPPHIFFNLSGALELTKLHTIPQKGFDIFCVPGFFFIVVINFHKRD